MVGSDFGNAVLAAQPNGLRQVTTEAGLNDLVIMDPGKHERGLPAVLVTYMNEHPEIEIPPTLHVHRYYYSGDKIFQGPIIQGGPTVVVASHPKTGQRMYIDVVLPAGTPRIQYTGNAITYIYNATRRRVEIKFQHFPFRSGVAVVKHHSGKGLNVAIRDKRQQVGDHVKETMQNSQTRQCGQRALHRRRPISQRGRRSGGRADHARRRRGQTGCRHVTRRLLLDQHGRASPAAFLQRQRRSSVHQERRSPKHHLYEPIADRLLFYPT